MVATVLKQYFKKKEPTVIKYRKHKNFCNDRFRSQLLNELNKGLIKISDLEHFNATILKILDHEAPIKMKYVRANEAPFMNKTIKKAIMKRSRLRNKFVKNPSEENNLNYKKQRNFCVTLFRNEKKISLKVLIPKELLTTKHFGRPQNLLFRTSVVFLKT